MTIEELEATAKDILRQLKHKVRRTETLSPVFRAYYKNGSHYDFKLPLGSESLMNSGEAKEILFDWFRRHTQEKPVVAWIFATDIFMAKATEEGIKHINEFEHYKDQGFVTLEKMGWVVVEEAIGINAQIETDVILMQQYYTRKPRLEFLGPPQTRIQPMDQFGGRQKMWGATELDITGFDKSRTGAIEIGVDALTARKKDI
jgi:hypothetical protein